MLLRQKNGLYLSSSSFCGIATSQANLISSYLPCFQEGPVSRRPTKTGNPIGCCLKGYYSDKLNVYKMDILMSLNTKRMKIKE